MIDYIGRKYNRYGSIPFLFVYRYRFYFFSPSLIVTAMKHRFKKNKIIWKCIHSAMILKNYIIFIYNFLDIDCDYVQTRNDINSLTNNDCIDVHSFSNGAINNLKILIMNEFISSSRFAINFSIFSLKNEAFLWSMFSRIRLIWLLLNILVHLIE